jgi:hypothetical protein
MMKLQMFLFALGLVSCSFASEVAEADKGGQSQTNRQEYVSSGDEAVVIIERNDRRLDDPLVFVSIRLVALGRPVWTYSRVRGKSHRQMWPGANFILNEEDNNGDGIPDAIVIESGASFETLFDIRLVEDSVFQVSLPEQGN